MNLMQRRRALMAQAAAAEDLHLNDILTLDGIMNTRAGHSSTTTTWEDLSGNNNDFSKRSGANSVVWDANCAKFDATDQRLTLNKSILSGKTAISIEVISKITGNGSTTGSGYYFGLLLRNGGGYGTDQIRVNTRNDNEYQLFYDNVRPNVLGSSANITRYICATISENVAKFYVDGDFIENFNVNFSSSIHSSSWYVGGGSTGAWSPRAEIYRIGISGSVFGATEVAERYQYFKKRFNF